MRSTFLTSLFLLSTLVSFSQSGELELLLSDSTMANATVSFFVADADSGKTLMA